MRIKGVIFDLDGTLVDSRLNFDAMRAEMGLPNGAPILETLQKLPPEDVRRCEAILARHEEEGARCAVAMPGAVELVALLHERNIPRAVITRNSRRLAEAVIARLRLAVDPLFAREDAPAKPEPAAILSICDAWQVRPTEVVMIGDYRFDLEAGRRAGALTAWYSRGRTLAECPWAEDADYVIDEFGRAADVLFGG